MLWTHITSRVSWLVTADRAQLDSPRDIFYTHDLGMFQPELPAVILPCSRVLTDYTLDGIDDDFIGSIANSMDILE